ncbi:CheR family methyltransferase [Hyalangium rubrum]|uniref:CheR family methyltransferase n=1 Tax=Hyalangium rubrum TaxID=3103134 RepID=A0ABU5GVJ0_9BACT|nr:CheR family methyltransferase [Hyalangium sp. s54d21]MDY7225185.1 CheR family methyltransferase [Hyalangium sp. s54d21]
MSEVERVEELDEATLSKVESVLREASGLTLATSVRRSLSTALLRAADARKMDAQAFLKQLLAKEPSVVASFVEYAVIGETYFFRHPEHLHELAREACLHSGPFRVWSAGCATGEEPYSISMTLIAAGLSLDNIKVTATDISSRALQRARAASYNSWSVRRIEPAMERRFLSVQGEVVTVSPQACKPVEFQQHNLMMDSAPVSEQDAVFCRNVLIYFPQEVVRLVLVKLLGALKPGGLLFLSPAEVPLTNNMGLEVIEVQGTPILRLPRHKPSDGDRSGSRRPKLDQVRRLMSYAPKMTPPPVPQPVAPPPMAPPASPLAAFAKLATPPTSGSSLPPVSATVSTPRSGSGPITGPISKPITGPVSKPITGPVSKPITGPIPASVTALSSAQAAVVAPPPGSPAPPPAALTPDDALRQALAAAREGKYDHAELMAKEAARKLVPEAYLLLAMVAEARGDLNGAVDAVRKALYLDPQMALGHATLMTLYTRLNRREDADRARQNALRALDGLDDDHPLRGVETVTAGGLRQALAARGRSGWQGAS